MTSAAEVLLERAERVAAATDRPGTITRLYGGRGLRGARACVEAWMRDAGAETAIDRIGNLTGRWPGGFDGEPALVLGSHLDTVPDGGRYDGALGVLTALAAAESFAGRERRRPLHVVAFADEEGTRFGTSFLGSRGWLGLLGAADEARTDADGVVLRDALAGFGAGEEIRPAAPPAAYVEVHIEQGPVLERAGVPLGVVDAVDGQTTLELRLRGTAGHAGTVPMTARADALAAAAAIVLAAEATAIDTAGLVATTGELSIDGPASNVIPGEVTMTLDVRHREEAARARALDAITRRASEIAAARGVTLEIERRGELASTAFAPELIDALRAAARDATGGPVPTLSSGAGHDAAIVATVAPAGMLFVRCAGGVSHSPAEAVAVEDVAAAIAALTAFVAGRVDG